MILCLDSGNSQVKYGVLASSGAADWLCCGSLAHTALGRLAEHLAAYPAVRHIVCANVAGAAALARLRDALRFLSATWHEVRSGAMAAGVRNAYAEPLQLGVDRWCALIGARHAQPGKLLVVMAGTATTIDALTAEGEFCGGHILPGQRLMRQALARDTAALPLAEGAYRAWPQTTQDAIESGTLLAQIGAIECAWAAWPDSVCLLSGGASRRLAAYFSRPVRQIDNLPLLGLRQLARLELRLD
ncbi:type III pantothenate kinase [Azonexus sp.]|uniref:type III pantothenate kinase n=1 Tax=Azonexus sp. TaxID=1872668 RepID=UPI0039E2C672